MNITINISDNELTEDDKLVIRECLRLSEEDNLQEHLSKLAKASFIEYVKMFKEKGLPTRADEVQQERLFFLLNHYFMNRVPYEHEISSIFQITQSQSRTLLRNTNSRFRTKISLFIRNTIKSIIRTALLNHDSGKYEMEITSGVIKEEINTYLSQRNAQLFPLTKKRGYLAIYECPEDTYDFLREQFEIDITDD
ncbi:hypothetical protein J8L85_11070 [Maribacter sp. MMG018]|uniref:hypothetical protein n=1 Tax=Maribacter sp. MMG018 TaxID=2822688 RepID=UPI001B38C628|nr:hypothetical protein [Maribacter sp. MMG018]MBQ4914981.1 hypothetical protein [Maribacter sp. MMG018]